jgi:thiol-disulfide isomerase/thioredoxin
MAVADTPAIRAGRRLWPWIGAGAVVVAALVVAVAVSGSGSDGSNAGTRDAAATGSGEAKALVQTAPVRVTGTTLPTLADGADRAIGATAPTVTGTSFDGSAVSVQPGRPTLVLFLAHWCPHCQREVPALVKHFKESGLPGGVDVVAVATATSPDSPNYPPSSWLGREGWPTRVLVDSADSTAGQAFGLPGFPYIVALNASGKVVARLSGEFSGDQFDSLAARAKG